MNDVLQLFKRNFSSAQFDAKAVQMFCWASSLLVMVGGILKLTRLPLTESELFFGILLVMSMSILLVIAGILVPIAKFVSQQQRAE
jgi:uncharacterized membrane protein